jgi:hypothetical protein
MLIQDKIDLIDYFFQHNPAKAFAELGCAWGVDGGYGFHILDHYEVSRGVQVDGLLTEKMKERAPNYPQLQLIQSNFCEANVPKLVGDVDVVVLFDVLLHQVKPDWDDLLNIYAPRTKHFLIYNQQWISSAHTTRLLDFGREEYFKKIPAGSENFKSYVGLFDRLDQPMSGEPGRLFRDTISIWQWGITDADLINKLAELGFNMQFFKNGGQAFGLSDFENHGFLFTRRE